MSKNAGWILVLAGIFAVAILPEYIKDDDWSWWLCLGMLAGAWAFIHGWDVRRKKRMVEDTATSKVRSLAIGLVELSGKALPFKQLFHAPFSGEDVLYCHYTVSEHVGRDTHLLAEYEAGYLFYLEDETGKVLVDPAKADWHLEARQYQTGPFSGDTEESCLRGLEVLGVQARSRAGLRRRFTCEEWTLRGKEDVYVLGTASNIPQGQREGLGNENVIVGKGEGRPFYISDKPENAFVGDLGIELGLCLYGGPALTVVCLAVFMLRYF
ncbi:MAG: hypothetical protein JW937_05705 [Candidatus Omnitrophica bacterium]|nr:hypothetical protein [Candidatus Omnitrophota bacterium]